MHTLHHVDRTSEVEVKFKKLGNCDTTRFCEDAEKIQSNCHILRCYFEALREITITVISKLSYSDKILRPLSISSSFVCRPKRTVIFCSDHSRMEEKTMAYFCRRTNFIFILAWSATFTSLNKKGMAAEANDDWKINSFIDKI